MFRHLASIPRRVPFTFAVGYAGAKTIGADVAVQKYIEKAPEIDKKRAAVFLCFGIIQVGFVQYMLYCRLFPRLFQTAGTFNLKPFAEKIRDRVGILNVGKMVCLDQFVYHPLMYFPVFYTCQEFINGGASSPTTIVRNALQKYSGNYKEDLKALWKIYIPVSILQCSVVPLHLRVPFVATVGIFWCAILSFMRGDDVRAKDDNDAAVSTIATLDFNTLSEKLGLAQVSEFAAEKTAEQMQRLAKLLHEAPLFSDIDGKAVEALLVSMKCRKIPAGSTVFTEGEMGESLFIVEAGCLERVKNINGTPKVVKRLMPGDVFGESILVEYCPRVTSVVAREDCMCWELDKETVLNAVRDSALPRRNKFIAVLSSILPDVNTLVPENFKKGKQILQQGPAGNEFFIVQEGYVVAVQHDQQKTSWVTSYGPGDYFGRNTLQKQQSRSVSLIVESDFAKVLSMSREAFDQLEMHHFLAMDVAPDRLL
jgi:protein Mpv17